MVEADVKGWLLGFVLFASVAGLHAAPPPDPTAAVMQRPIGASPAQAFYLVEALRGLGRPKDANDLTRYLVHALVDEASGQAHDTNLTVSQATGLAQQLPELDHAVDLRARWHDVGMIFGDREAAKRDIVEVLVKILLDSVFTLVTGKKR